MVKDYNDIINEFWPTIILAWKKYSINRPIIECNLDSWQVMAYPSEDYIETLSDRDKNLNKEQFNKALDNGGMVVFIRDTKNRALKSYIFPIDSIC